MPLSRKEVAQLWHKARCWDRETHRPGHHGGVIGRTALDVLYTLCFDFLNYATGRLDPSLDAIAAKAGMARRTVVNALARLRDLGLLNWQRRCEEDRDASGRFRLRQRTNAYGLLPPSQWRGYRDNRPHPPTTRVLFQCNQGDSLALYIVGMGDRWAPAGGELARWKPRRG